MIKNKRKALFITSFLLTYLFFCIFPIENSKAAENTIYVDDSGGKNFTSIQPAIDAADNGDIVFVYSGTYYENIQITKNIILTGENKDTTIIDGGENSFVIYGYGLSGDEKVISISGFTVKNAGGTGNDCIALSYVINSNINNNKILNSDKSDGIQLDHCSGITISNNQILGNTASGISLTRSSNNYISNNVIQNNQKGIYFWDSSSNNEIFDNIITGNSQYGVHNQISSSQSQNNYFYRNDFKINGINAKDPYSNFWSKNNQGNYWDDYNDYDSDENGIGDSPYNIDSGSNQDDYPLGYFLDPEPPSSNQKPTAYQPTIYPNPATIGSSISFSGSGSDSDGYIEAYNWRSNLDGQLSINSDFSTSSLSLGTHSIYFKVKDNDGEWSLEKSTTLIINQIEVEDPIINDENSEPIAIIDSIYPNPAVYTDNIKFIGHGSDEDGSIVDWKWMSSIDGYIGNKGSINVSDLSIGTHTIYFQVRDNDTEWSKQVTESLIISQFPLNKAPVANASGPYFGNVKNEVFFIGSSSYDEDGEITEYIWIFGDGIIGSGESVTHAYAKPGNYTVKLTVTDDEGEGSTDTTIVTIIESIQENSSSSGFTDFHFEIPFPFLIILECIIVVVGISIFLIWIKRK